MEDLKGVVTETRELIEEYVKPEVIEVTEPGTGLKVPAVKTKDGVEELSATIFDDYRDQPKRRRGVAQLTKLDSFIDHVNRFKDPDSALFASDSRSQPSLAAVLDYHRSGSEADPRFGDHRTVHRFPLSDEWTAWTGKNAQSMKMATFAAFLEDRIVDVVDLIAGEDAPGEDLQKFINICGGSVASPAKLVELSRGLHVFEAAVCTETVNLSSGEGQIAFESEHRDAAGNKLKVPGLFLIAIPVFKHGDFYRIAARLRYRKTNEGLMFWFELWRADNAFDNAFSNAVERARVETDLPLFYGQPE